MCEEVRDDITEPLLPSIPFVCGAGAQHCLPYCIPSLKSHWPRAINSDSTSQLPTAEQPPSQLPWKSHFHVCSAPRNVPAWRSSTTLRAPTCRRLGSWTARGPLPGRPVVQQSELPRNVSQLLATTMSQKVSDEAPAAQRQSGPAS